MFRALGIGQSDFLFSDTPMRVSEVIVPHPSLRRQAWAHPAYADMCKRIGRRILAGRPIERTDRPVWLAADRAGLDPTQIEHEDRLESRLADVGVAIAEPALMSLAEQIALFACHPIVMGTLDPLFLLSAFVDQAPNVIARCPENSLDSNFALLDRLTQADAAYVYSPDGSRESEADDLLSLLPAGCGVDLTVRQTSPDPDPPSSTPVEEIVAEPDGLTASPPPPARGRKVDLAPTTEFWGGAEIRAEEPGVTVVEDAYYIPHQDHTGWGIFDHNDVMVDAAVDRAYPQQQMMGQAADGPTKYFDVREEAPKADYIYAGRFTPHFGHYLVEVLPRYWALTRGLKPGQKLLIHSDVTRNFFAGFDFAAEICTALGLTREDFVWSPRPMWVRSLTIPHATLSQQAWAMPAYLRFCQHVGRRLLAKAPPVPDDRPVWLSKARLSAGVNHIGIEDELAIEQVLSQAGVEIVDPELMSFTEKVRLFSSRSTVLGTISSAMHIVPFSLPTSRIVALTMDHVMNSNFVMLDRLRGRSIECYHDPGVTRTDDDPRFMATFRLSDPEGVARALLAMI